MRLRRVPPGAVGEPAGPSSASVAPVTSPDTPEEPTPVAASVRAARVLAAAPDGPAEVLHACPEAVHLRVGGHVLSVAATGAAGLPISLRTTLSRVTTGACPTPYLEAGTLHLGVRALVTGRLVDVRAPRIDAARVPTASPAAHQGTPRPRVAGLVLASLDAETVPLLIGRGEGLTPLGDDVVCGWLAAHRALGVPTPAVDAAVRRHLGRTTPFSAALLECALEGEVADPVRRYLRALGTPAAPAARQALERFGHTSGRGLALGLDLGLAAALDTRAAA